MNSSVYNLTLFYNNDFQREGATYLEMNQIRSMNYNNNVTLK